MKDQLVPRVLELRGPTVPALPLVFDSPHSGTDYPEDFGHQAPIAAVRKAEDTYVDEIYDAAPARGAVLLRALFPRSYIDPNRAADDLDTSMIEGDWPGRVAPSPKTALGLGLLWSRYPPGLPLYGRKLTVAEVRRRIEAYHKPYHDALRQALDATYARFGVVWHINCHSMPSVSNDMSAEGSGVPRADFTLGDRDGTTCSAEFTETVRAMLAAMGYRVTVNDPYKGSELIRAWSAPQAGRHSLLVEISRRLYMNEETFEKSEGFAKLQADIRHLIAELAQLATPQQRSPR